MSEQKDFWDKLQAIGSLLSGIALPLILAVAAHKADELQRSAQAGAERLQKAADERARERELAQGDTSLRIAQANTIPPLIDGLLSADPKRRKLAITAVLIALPADGPQLVRELGMQVEDEDVRSYAANALKDRKDQLVAELYAPDADVRKTAAKALVDGWRKDPELAKTLVERAKTHKDNQNGVYNSVVVLGGLSKAALEPNRPELEKLVQAAATQGPSTAAQAERLQARLHAKTPD
ncbi:MAG TPA: hypothetical protein VI299_02825 [Polyangiales bacterium]